MKNNILYPIYLAIAVTIGIGLGILLSNKSPVMGIQQVNEREAKLRKVMDLINYQYVDAVNADSLLDETIESMLNKLDPHSSYIPENQVAEVEETMSGQFVGVGIEFRVFRDTLVIVRILPNGPAEEAGLQAGQRILQADSVALHGPGVNNSRVINTLKGRAGTAVDLLLYDPEQKALEKQTIQRGAVPVQSVERMMINDSTGYLKISRFTEPSGGEVARALGKLREEGARQLILDLRSNPGGLLREAREIADQFLEEGETIVFTKNRKGEERYYRASDQGRYQKGDLAVLINSASASASEIVAGALQDNDRATVLGQRSFGKGLVQEEITLDDGSRLRLTTQRYFTPTGRSIQKNFDQYETAHAEPTDFQLHAQPHQDSLHPRPDSYTTPQGRTVLGGGGIKPDLTIEADSQYYSRRMYQLAMTVNLEERAFAYADAHRSQLEGWSLDQFARNFSVTDSVLSFFFTNLPEHVLSDISEREQAIIDNQLKSYLAYQLFGPQGYRRIHAPYDAFLQSALQALDRPLPGLPRSASPVDSLLSGS